MRFFGAASVDDQRERGDERDHQHLHASADHGGEITRPADDVLADVRNAIYAAIASGTRPELAALSDRLGLDRGCRAMRIARWPTRMSSCCSQGTLDIWWAPPFSPVPTPFRVAPAGVVVRPVRVGRVRHSGRARTRCADRRRCALVGRADACGVEHGRAYGDGVIHLLVPAAHFWDDIGYT